MEFRVLKYFVMVAQEENMTKAAQKLHITQPTLSRQIMQLEEELGCKLFRRRNHSIDLTEEGILLKKRAQDIINQETQILKELRSDYEEIAGEIVIGSGETKNIESMMDAMEKFQKIHPMIQYELYTANADDMKDKLEQGAVDFAVLTEPVDISKYNFIRFAQREVWGILVRSDSELSSKNRIRPRDLLNESLITVKRLSVQNELENWFGKYYDQIHITATYNLINNAAAMVRHNIGVALCFEFHEIDHRLKFIPLYPEVKTGSVLVWRKDQVLSKVAEHFLEFYKKYVKGIIHNEE